MTANFDHYKLPVLKNRKGDLTKRWYIEYYLWDTQKNELVRQVKYCPTSHKTAKERRTWANREIAILSDLMLKGYYAKQPKLPSEPELKPEKPPATTKVSDSTDSTGNLAPIDGDDDNLKKVSDIILQIVKLKEKTNRDRTGQTYRNTYNDNSYL